MSTRHPKANSRPGQTRGPTPHMYVHHQRRKCFDRHAARARSRTASFPTENEDYLFRECCDVFFVSLCVCVLFRLHERRVLHQCAHSSDECVHVCVRFYVCWGVHGQIDLLVSVSVCRRMVVRETSNCEVCLLSKMHLFADDLDLKFGWS